MLFHSLYERGFRRLPEPAPSRRPWTRSRAFRAAWQAALDGHDILRAGFLWQGDLEQPLRVIHKHLELPFAEHDWRGRGARRGSRRAGRERTPAGFRAGAGALAAAVLVRMDEERYHLVYTHHHILLDGWSSAQLLGSARSLHRRTGRAHGWALLRLHHLAAGTGQARQRSILERTTGGTAGAGTPGPGGRRRARAGRQRPEFQRSLPPAPHRAR
ncbi:condensation domain-containing protein [Pseudomonas aeruginosa]|nr:condensation domain-containing protein [Pseudomonas aeruginosa]